MKKLTLIAICALLISASISIAQPPPPPPPEARTRMHEKVRTMKMWKLTEELDLSEEKAAKFFPLFNKFEKKVQAILDENDDLYRKLEGLIQAEEDGKKITTVIEQIEANEMKILKERTEFRKDAAKILDDAQIAKLVMFQHHFTRKLRQKIEERHMDKPDRPMRKGQMRPDKDEEGDGTPIGMRGGCENHKRQFGAQRGFRRCALQQSQLFDTGEDVCTT